MSTSGLRIALLGEPRFEFASHAFAFLAPPAALPLLVYLLLHRRSPVYREAVCNVFWPCASMETARANLRRHLHYIKKALPKAEGFTWIDAGYSTVQWNAAAPYWLDIEAFALAVRNRANLAAAIDLYAGDLLANFSLPFIERARADLRAAYKAALRDAAMQASEMGAHRDAVRYLTALLENDPWDESALRDLLRAKIKCGSRAEAMAQYKDYCERLKSHFDVEPAVETLNVIRLARAVGVS